MDFWIVETFSGNSFSLERFGAGFAGANPHGALHLHDKNFAIADPAGVGRLGDHFDNGIGLVIFDDDLDLSPWAENSRRIPRRGKSPFAPSGVRSL